MDRYTTVNGKRYFNWSCVKVLLADMELKAEKLTGKPLYSAARDTYYASSLMINTGRAGTEWIKAWASANPDKLVQFVHNNYDGTVDSAKECIHTYLVRYCKLNAN